MARHLRVGAHERHLLADHAEGADRQDDRDRKNRVPLAARIAEEVDELVAPFALERDVKRLVGLERRIHQKAERAAGLENGTVARVLRQQWTLAVSPRPQADAGPP